MIKKLMEDIKQSEDNNHAIELKLINKENDFYSVELNNQFTWETEVYILNTEEFNKVNDYHYIEDTLKKV